MKKALVEPDGRIAQIATDIFPVAPPLEWVDVPDDTTTRHTWDGTNVLAPVIEPVIDTSDAESEAAAHKAMLRFMVDEPKFDALPEVADHRPRR